MSQKEVEAVLEHHLRALVELGDVEEVMKDYGEQSVCVGVQGVMRGLAEIRGMFERIISMLPPGSRFDIKTRRCTEDIAYLVWSAESAAYDMPLGCDTLFIEAGVIVRQSSIVDVRPKRQE